MPHSERGRTLCFLRPLCTARAPPGLPVPMLLLRNHLREYLREGSYALQGSAAHPCSPLQGFVAGPDEASPGPSPALTEGSLPGPVRLWIQESEVPRLSWKER